MMRVRRASSARPLVTRSVQARRLSFFSRNPAVREQLERQGRIEATGLKGGLVRLSLPYPPAIPGESNESNAVKLCLKLHNVEKSAADRGHFD